MAITKERTQAIIYEFLRNYRELINFTKNTVGERIENQLTMARAIHEISVHAERCKIAYFDAKLCGNLISYLRIYKKGLSLESEETVRYEFQKLICNESKKLGAVITVYPFSAQDTALSVTDDIPFCLIELLNTDRQNFVYRICEEYEETGKIRELE